MVSNNKFITRMKKGLINGVYVEEEWYDGSIISVRTYNDSDYKITHSEGEPAIIYYYDNCSIRSESYYKHDLVHRDNDLPAATTYYDNGSICATKWYRDGERHRSVGPAHVGYFMDGIINNEHYYVSGLLHNTFGPAIIQYEHDGTILYQQYFVDGKKLTYEKFVKQYLPNDYDKYIREKIYKINSKKYKLTSIHGKQLIFTEI